MDQPVHLATRQPASREASTPRFCQRPRAFVMPTLEVTAESGDKQFFELTADETIVGRDQFCDIVLRRHTVSRQHARIVRAADGYLHRRPVEPERHLSQRPPDGRPHADQGPGPDPHLRSGHGVSRGLARRGRSGDRPTGDAAGLRGRRAAARGAPERRRRRHHGWRSRRPTGRGADASSQARFRAALKISLDLEGGLEVDEILPKILDSLFEIFPQAVRGYILLAEGADGHLVPRAIKHRRSESGHSMTFGPISRKMALHVMTTAEAILMDDGPPEPSGRRQPVGVRHAQLVDDLRAADGAVAHAAGNSVSRHDRPQPTLHARRISTCW